MAIEPRDKIVDPAWWTGPFRERLTSNIESSGDRVPQRISNERALHDLNQYNAWRLMLWRFDYSAGRDLDDLAAEFELILQSWIRGMDGNSILFELPNLAAIAQMLGLKESLREFHPGGKVDFGATPRSRLVQWILGDPAAWRAGDYVYSSKNKLSQSVRQIIELAPTDPTGARECLEKFVREQWYKGSRSEPWWGSHDDDGAPHGYVGYWCFRGAAVAKMCGLDDSGLKGHKYYPYDLAHFLDP